MTREEELILQEKELIDKLEGIRLERKALKEAELVKEKVVNQEVIAFLREHRNFILSHLNHTCSSCSDDDSHKNGYISDRGYARCQKCFLTEILDGLYDADDFKVTFDFTITKWDT